MVVGNVVIVLLIRTQAIPIGCLTLRMHIIHQCIIIHILGITVMDIMHPITDIIEVIIRTEAIMAGITAVHFILLPAVPTREVQC